MKEKPILFSGEMVRAILSGAKTQTRRVVKPQPHAGVRETVVVVGNVLSGFEDGHGRQLRCPFGQPGDRLWVRETFLHELQNYEIADTGDYDSFFVHNGKIEYGADGAKERHLYPNRIGSPWMAKRPSIHMPRWASRITLEVTDVRVERLQDISEDDARAEGVEPIKRWTHYGEGATDGGRLYWRQPFCELWDSINAKRAPWASNPWVWCIEFKRVEVPR